MLHPEPMHVIRDRRGLLYLTGEGNAEKMDEAFQTMFRRLSGDDKLVRQGAASLRNAPRAIAGSSAARARNSFAGSVTLSHRFFTQEATSPHVRSGVHSVHRDPPASPRARGRRPREGDGGALFSTPASGSAQCGR